MLKLVILDVTVLGVAKEFCELLKISHSIVNNCHSILVLLATLFAHCNVIRVSLT